MAHISLPECGGVTIETLKKYVESQNKPLGIVRNVTTELHLFLINQENNERGCYISDCLISRHQPLRGMVRGLRQ